jgi:hypothetical protein
MSNTVVVTGAFSYTGRYTTRLLLERGLNVRTLTGHPPKTDVPVGVTVFPYNFDRPTELECSLAGASALINTYWVRFPRRQMTFETAIQNSRTLIHAARSAGLKRIVHVSIANPSLDSPSGYYKGKALVEQGCANPGSPIASSDQRYLVRTTFSLTTSHGSFETCPSLAFLATASMVFARSTWRTWRNCWPTPRMARTIP